MASPNNPPLQPPLQRISAAKQRELAEALQAQANEAAAKALGVLLFKLLLAPLMLLVTWNYGITEVIQAFGGPDANIGVLVAYLTTFFIRLLMGELHPIR